MKVHSAMPPTGRKLGSMVTFVKSIDLITDIHLVNLRTFDLNLLRVLGAVLDEPQVSSAARRLNLSQPATSAALTRLRNALGDPLLVRAGNQMVPSALAQELRPKVRRLLAEIEQTLRAPADFSPANSERSFRIAANDYAVTTVLSPLLEHLQQYAPRVSLEILPLEDDFDKRLAEDNYDLAVRDRWSMRSWRRLETLFREDYVCIARRDHPRLSKKPTLNEFLSEGHVLISPQGRAPGVVDKALERLKRTRRVAVTLPHFLAAPAVVARTDYVMTIARRIALQSAQIYKLRIFVPPLTLHGFEVVMAWHPRGEADAGVNWLKDQVRKSAGAARREKT
jgi:DNA-binding transcriptional LysR family regulator